MKTAFALFLFAIAAAVAFFIYARTQRANGNGAMDVAARRPLSRLEQVLYGRLVRALPDHVVLAQVAYSQILAVHRGGDSRALRNRFDRLVADFVVCRRDFVVVAVIDDRGPLDFSLVKRFVKLCREQRVAIWHGHDYKSNLLGLLVRPHWPMRLVTTVHGWVKFTWKTPLYYAIDRLCLPRYERVICVSDDLAEQCLFEEAMVEFHALEAAG